MGDATATFKYDERKFLSINDFPDSVYATATRTLFKDKRALSIGIYSASLAPFVLFWKTNDFVQILFSSLFLICGLLRMYTAYKFTKTTHPKTTREEYNKWENIYIFQATLFIAIIGSWLFVGVLRNDDPFVILLSLSVGLSFLIGIVGRNFSSERVVKWQSVIFGIFTLSCLLSFGDIYYAILGFFLVPLLFAVKSVSFRLKTLLIQSELNAMNAKTIAKRFDVALNNVSHGIAMFDIKGNIIVANKRFTKLVGLGNKDIIGSSSSVLSVAKIEGTQDSTLSSEVLNCLSSKTGKKFTFKIETGQIIEADYSSLPNGGVILLSDVTQRQASEKAIRELANFDPLTGLANRRYFVDRLRCEFYEDKTLKPCSMFFVDLDKFKEVNDMLGHAIGDKLLKIVSSRIQLLLPENALLCRFGGDEFVIVFPNMCEINSCSKFAELIIAEICLPSLIEGHTIKIGATIGIAMAPQNGTNAEELLQFTDAALHVAKTRGQSSYSFYNEKIGAALKLKTELENDLRAAVENETLEVHYQPLINLKRGRITTCEALVRWRHEKYGNISPAEFILMAEESGYIVQLGEYVMRKAMQACLTWPGDVRVAVNVSSVQFQETDMTKVIAKLLKETGLPAQKLDIEVTETSMLYDMKSVSTTLNEISNKGVNISLDDFGTGFSSLSYLHDLPFDKIKIDRSFIANGLSSQRNLTLLKGVAKLIKSLNLSLVMEGIEDTQQLQLISEHIEMDEVQGFLFSRPLKPKDIKFMIDSLNVEKQPLARSA